MEDTQITVTKWILATRKLTYKERLQKLSLFPLALYHELHVLIFLDILEGDTTWTGELSGFSGSAKAGNEIRREEDV